MSTQQIILLAIVAAIVVFMYVILPKLNLNVNTGKLFRALVFLVVIIFLGIDFYQKEKYWYFIPLALGSIGFLFMLKNSKEKE